MIGCAHGLDGYGKEEEALYIFVYLIVLIYKPAHNLDRLHITLISIKMGHNNT